MSRVEQSPQSPLPGFRRRIAIAGAAGAGLTWLLYRGCEETTTDTETQIQNEVKRLAGELDDKSLVKRLYLDPNYTKELSSLFTPLKIAAAKQEEYYASTRWKIDLSPHDQYLFLKPNVSPIPRKTYSSIRVSIEFNNNWLKTKSETVKTLAMKKEAIHLLLWPYLVAITANEFQKKGLSIQIIEPGLSYEKALHTATYDYVMLDEDASKNLDYAGYLGILFEIEQIQKTGTEQERRELRSNIGTLGLPEEARKRHIPIEQLQWTNGPTEEFLFYAFSAGSPWLDIVRNPRYPSPQIPRQP